MNLRQILKVEVAPNNLTEECQRSDVGYLIAPALLFWIQSLQKGEWAAPYALTANSKIVSCQREGYRKYQVIIINDNPLEPKAINLVINLPWDPRCNVAKLRTMIENVNQSLAENAAPAAQPPDQENHLKIA